MRILRTDECERGSALSARVQSHDRADVACLPASLQAVGQDPTFRSESNVVLVPALVWPRCACGARHSVMSRWAKSLLLRVDGALERAHGSVRLRLAPR